MRATVTTLADLDEAIAADTRSDYMYMYPPRQTYRPHSLSESALTDRIDASARRLSRLNLYVHFPFCKQICGFCNLFTTTVRDDDVHKQYAQALIRELRFYRDLTGPKTAPTVYFGGGTPTLLDPALLAEVLDEINDLWAVELSAEIAIEVDPQTIDASGFTTLRRIGFNRVNLGLQSRNAMELALIGRRYTPEEQTQRVTEALSAGFDNVCLDLIYGLPGQTADNWRTSVDECIALGPETICCYPLTRRPHTGFARRPDSPQQGLDYRMWYEANERLQAAGYVMATHVRWVRPGGGYRQKELHWGMENLLGVGAGARSYLWEIDLRQGYSILHRQSTLASYLDNIENGDVLPREGYVMNDDERLRKSVVLGLHRYDQNRYRELVGMDAEDSFHETFEGLVDRHLLSRDGDLLQLTSQAMPYRDLIVQLFFSSEVRKRLAEFDYAE